MCVVLSGQINKYNDDERAYPIARRSRRQTTRKLQVNEQQRGSVGLVEALEEAWKCTMDVAKIEYCDPHLTSHGFYFKACDQKVIVRAFKLEKGLFLWIGSFSHPVLEDLALSMTTPYGNDPLQTKLLGDVLNMTSMNLGSRLSKKLDKPVYVSFNVDSDMISLPAIEAAIVEEMKNAPHLF